MTNEKGIGKPVLDRSAVDKNGVSRCYNYGPVGSIGRPESAIKNGVTIPEVVNYANFQVNEVTSADLWGPTTHTKSYQQRMKNVEENCAKLREIYSNPKYQVNSKSIVRKAFDNLNEYMQPKAYDEFKIALNSANPTVNGNSEFYARQLTEFYPLALVTKYPDIQYQEYTSIYNGKPYATEIASIMGDYQNYDFRNLEDISTTGLEATDPIVITANVNEDVNDIWTSHLAIDFEITEQWAMQEAPNYGVGGSGPSPIIKYKFDGLNRGQEVILNERCLGIENKSDYKIQGIFTNPDVPKFALGAIPGTNPAPWASKDRNLILEDIVSSVNFLSTNSKNVHQANTLVMSLRAYNTFKGLPRSAQSDIPVDQWVTMMIPGIDRIVPDPFLDGIGQEGTDVMYITEKSPENHFFSVNAKSLGMTPDFYNGTQRRLPFMLRSSGFILLRAKSCLIVEGL